jgi:TorA maturation chaperone TorD
VENSLPIMIDTNNLAEALIAEQLTLSLLGKLWFEFPEVEFIADLAAQGVFEEIPLGNEQSSVQEGLALLQAWAKEHKDGLPEEAFDAIRFDYTRLFIGPGKVLAPPWESVYFNETRSIFQEKTLEVREWYCRFGLESVKIRKEPDDHIGLELNFLAHLAGQAAAALEAQNQPEYESLLDAQRQFANQHLFAWFGGWFKLVEKYARTDFYRGLALVTRGALLEVSALLGI